MADIITSAGFDKPTMTEIINQIGDAMQLVVGPVNRAPDSVTGQWIGVEGEQVAILMEALEYAISGRSLATAEGSALDALGDWMGGIDREGETYTTVNAVVYGAESTQLTAGTQASAGSETFRLTINAVISRASLLDGEINVSDATKATYTIRVNGVDYTYTKLAADSAQTIATALAALVDASTVVDSSATGSVIKVTSENLVSGVPVSIAAGLTWQTIGSPAIFEAVNAGPVEVAVGALSNPVSAVDKWTGVNNLVAGNTGHDRESDTSYRQRLYAARRAQLGAATAPAIEARLLNEVSGVTLAMVLENDSMAVANGIPPKSINVVVNGGAEQDIADAIWKYKAAGIGTYGSTSLTVTDSHGNKHTVMFSRPVSQPIYVKINVTLLDGEEELPADVITAIKQGVMNYAATLSINDDVITQRIYGYIYANTTGIGKMTVTVSTDNVTFTENNISIPAGTYAEFSESHMEVTGV